MQELIEIELGCIFAPIRIQYKTTHEHKELAIAHLDREWARSLVSSAVNRWLYQEDEAE